jgi:putative ABC transport system permease protein
MIAFLARRNLVRQRARTLLCALGIAVSTALLYDMQLLASGLRTSLGAVLKEVGFELRVFPRGSLPFSSEAVLPHGHALARQLAHVDGMADALPLWATTLYLARGDAAARPVAAFALGLDPARQTLYVIERGHAIAGPPDTAASAGAAVVASGDTIPIVLNARLADSLRVGPGDVVLAGTVLDAQGGGIATPRALRVTGVARFRFDLRTQRSAALRVTDLARLAGRDDDPAAFLLGRLAPGASGSRAVARWRSLHPETDTYEVGEILAQVRGQLSYFQQFSRILGAVSLLVTFLLVLTLLTLSVNERQGELAVLRALGLPRGRVVALVLAEGAALGALALVPGVLLGGLAARGLDAILTSSPGIPADLSFFVFTPQALAFTVLLVLVTATVAGAYPAWLAAQTNVALTLHREVT